MEHEERHKLSGRTIPTAKRFENLFQIFLQLSGLIRTYNLLTLLVFVSYVLIKNDAIRIC